MHVSELEIDVVGGADVSHQGTLDGWLGLRSKAEIDRGCTERRIGKLLVAHWNVCSWKQNRSEKI